MLVFGLLMVRDAVELVDLVLEHHLSLGLDRVLVIDNGSTDGTELALGRARRGGRVQVTRNDGAFRPGELATALARDAAGQGADWLLPFDADEFWHFPDTPLRRLLKRTEAGALGVRVVNFVQRRAERASSAEGLLGMTWRVPVPQGPVEECEGAVEARRIAFVEVLYPRKWLARATPSIAFGPGYHSVSGTLGPALDTEQAVILHAPLSSRAALEKKAEEGRRVEEAGFAGDECWHLRRFHRLQREGGLDAEWAANSAEQGRLDLHGTPRPLVTDRRLHELVARRLAPWWRRYVPRLFSGPAETR